MITQVISHSIFEQERWRGRVIVRGRRGEEGLKGGRDLLEALVAAQNWRPALHAVSFPNGLAGEHGKELLIFLLRAVVDYFPLEQVPELVLIGVLQELI